MIILKLFFSFLYQVFIILTWFMPLFSNSQRTKIFMKGVARNMSKTSGAPKFSQLPCFTLNTSHRCFK